MNSPKIDLGSVLHLTVKKEFFDLIYSGVKKEEYREVKRYWQTRLQINGYHRFEFKKFDHIQFKNGYGKNCPTFTVKCEGIDIGKPNKDWCGSMFKGESVFRIKLGEIVCADGV